MDKFTRIVALLLVAVAIVLAIVAFNIGSRHRSTPPPRQTGTTHPAPRKLPTYAVVVAATELAAGEPIQAGQLKLADWQRVPAHSFSHMQAVVGQVPLQAIGAGVAVTAPLLAHGLALQIPPGERALSIPVSEVAGAGNRIVPGDYVDVFFSIARPDSRHASVGRNNQEARLLMPRLRVLAYGGRDLPKAPPAGEPASATTSAKASPRNGSRTPPRPPTARTAVLAVPVDKVNRLLLAAQDGKLSLALRNPVDNGQPDPALFPHPDPVLRPRPHLAKDQHAQLATPENQAFAGIDTRGLAQPTPPAPVHRRRHHRASPRIEIIRGTQRSDLGAAPSPTYSRGARP